MISTDPFQPLCQRRDCGNSHVEAGFSLARRLAILEIVLLFCFCGYSISDAEQVTPGKDVRTHLNVRSAPSLQAAKVAELLRGQKAEVLAESGEWVEVKLPDGSRGFVMKTYVAVLGGPKVQPKPAPTTQDTNDRAAPLLAVPLTLPSSELDRTRQEVDSLTAFLKKYIGNVDSLRMSVAWLEAESRRRPAAGGLNMWPIVAALALALAAAAYFSRLWVSRLKTELLNDMHKQRESHASRRAFFAATVPRIEGVDRTKCTLFLNLVNCGDNAVSSLQASVFTIDTVLDQAQIDKELSFSTANLIPGQQEITFREDGLRFSEEYGPKYICIWIEHLDSVANERMQQNFTFRWEGVRAGFLRERIDHVGPETSDKVWSKVRELRWVRGNTASD